MTNTENNLLAVYLEADRLARAADARVITMRDCGYDDEAALCDFYVAFAAACDAAEATWSKRDIAQVEAVRRSGFGFGG